MQIKSKQGRLLRRGGRNIQKGSQQQKRVSAHGISGRDGRKSTGSDTTRTFTPCFLNHPLTSKSSFTKTNEDLQELLPNIYKCLKNAPGFVDDKDWKEMPPITELADYLVAKTRSAIPAGYEWMIKTGSMYNHFEKPEIVYYRDAKINDESRCVPLEWLTTIRDKNYYLFGLISATINFIYQACDMDLIHTKWNEYFIYNEGWRDDEDNIYLELNQIDCAKYHNDGEVTYFRNLIKSFPYTIENLIQRIKEYRPKRKLEASVKQWLELGIPVLENPASTSNYYLAGIGENYSDGDEMNIGDCLSFVWSFHDQCFETADEFMNDVYQNVGFMDTVEFGLFTQKKHILPSPVSNLENLIAFMNFGRGIYFQYFELKYKNQYDKRRKRYEI